MVGFIYLMRAADGCFKIGKSRSPLRREKDFSGLPFEVGLVHEILADDMDYWEERIHYIFQPERIRGEWFKLSEENVEWFSGLASLKRGCCVRTDEYIWIHGFCPCCGEPGKTERVSNMARRVQEAMV